MKFLNGLHHKIRSKMKAMPGKINDGGFNQMKTFKDFDERYTAPLHGFKDANDYWQRCSCKPFLKTTAIPTLIVNAKDDPFLAPSCYPIEEAETNPNLFLELPDAGGHIGFITLNHHGQYWSEWRAITFLNHGH
jgi:predicted alpha/beta-fold hydrolase